MEKIIEKEELLKNMEMADVIFEKIVHLNPRSAWNRGVVRYAMELMNNVDGKEITEKNLLGGADNWKEYSYGGSALIYDVDICHRLCTPSEIKRKRGGDLPPNRHETWLDVQARALYQAAAMIMRICELHEID